MKTYEEVSPQVADFQKQLNRIKILKVGGFVFVSLLAIAIFLTFAFDDEDKKIVRKEKDELLDFGILPVKPDLDDSAYRLVPEKVIVEDQSEYESSDAGKLYDDQPVQSPSAYLTPTEPLAGTYGDSYGSYGSSVKPKEEDNYLEAGKKSGISIVLGDNASEAQNFSQLQDFASAVGLQPDAASSAFQELSGFSEQRTAYSLQNQQRDKQNFMDGRDVDEFSYVQATPSIPVSNNEIKAGVVIPIQLITAINTDLPSDIIAVVSRDIVDSYQGQRVLIPRGTRLIGRIDSNVSFGQKRVLAYFNRFIRPDGVSLIVPNFPAVDRDGTGGLSARVNYHLGSIGLALGLSALANVTVDATNVAVENISNVLSRAVSNTADTSQEVTEQIVSKMLNKQPTMTVVGGTSAGVLITRDMIWPEFTQGRK